MTTSPIIKTQDSTWMDAQTGHSVPIRGVYQRVVERQLALMDERPLPLESMCISQREGLLVAIGWREERDLDQSAQLVTMGWQDEEERDTARLTLEHVILEALCRRAMEQTPSGKFIRWDIVSASRGLRAIMHLEPGVEVSTEQLAALATDALLQWLSDHPALEQRLLKRVVTI